MNREEGTSELVLTTGVVMVVIGADGVKTPIRISPRYEGVIGG